MKSKCDLDTIAAIGGGVRTDILSGDGFGTSLVKLADCARLLCPFTYYSRVWKYELGSHDGQFHEQRGRVVAVYHEGRTETPCPVRYDAVSPD